MISRQVTRRADSIDLSKTFEDGVVIVVEPVVVSRGNPVIPNAASAAGLA